MKRKLFSVLLSLLMLLPCIPLGAVCVSAETTENGLVYEIVDGEMTITGYTDDLPAKVIIPNTIEGYPVTRIGRSAFAECVYLRSIVIPETVVAIGDYAFIDSFLEKVTIGNGVTSIGKYAFAGCDLTSVDIPDSVISIGAEAFSSCFYIALLTLGNGVTSIDKNAFAQCYSLTNVYYNGTVKEFENISIDDGNDLLFDAVWQYIDGSSGVFNGMRYKTVNGEVIITGYTDDLPADLVIPSTIIGYPVTAIADAAFENCSILKSIAIPDGIIDIGAGTFYMCNELESVIIGNGVTVIGDTVFGRCKALTSVVIGNNVERIVYCAFSGCSSLTEVVIPDSVTTIDSFVFQDCTALETITIGDNITDIISWAFINTAYYNNEENWENDVLYIGNCLLEAKYTLSGNYTIKPETKTIGQVAFWECTNLQSVTIPESVTSVCSDAFGFCDSLTDVYYAGSQADREEIVIGKWNNDALLNATWHYNCINPKDHYSANVQHSVMETENGNGLAFRFELIASVGVKSKNEVDFTNATINYLGQTCKLVGMGAVLTNDATVGVGNFSLADVNGVNVLDVPTVYLQEIDEGSCAFATRIINIPEHVLERTIYAHPYYVVEMDGELITVYGDIDSASCAEYM